MQPWLWLTFSHTPSCFNPCRRLYWTESTIRKQSSSSSMDPCMGSLKVFLRSSGALYSLIARRSGVINGVETLCFFLSGVEESTISGEKEAFGFDFFVLLPPWGLANADWRLFVITLFELILMIVAVLYFAVYAYDLWSYVLNDPVIIRIKLVEWWHNNGDAMECSSLNPFSSNRVYLSMQQGITKLMCNLKLVELNSTVG